MVEPIQNRSNGSFHSNPLQKKQEKFGFELPETSLGKSSPIESRIDNKLLPGLFFKEDAISSQVISCQIMGLILTGNKNMAKKNQELEQALHSFVETYLESLEETYHRPLEPFEQYAEKMRHHITDQKNEFQERFQKGFEILKKELESRENK